MTGREIWVVHSVHIAGNLANNLGIFQGSRMTGLGVKTVTQFMHIIHRNASCCSLSICNHQQLPAL